MSCRLRRPRRHHRPAPARRPWAPTSWPPRSGQRQPCPWRSAPGLPRHACPRRPGPCRHPAGLSPGRHSDLRPQRHRPPRHPSRARRNRPCRGHVRRAGGAERRRQGPRRHPRRHHREYGRARPAAGPAGRSGQAAGRPPRAAGTPPRGLAPVNRRRGQPGCPGPAGSREPRARPEPHCPRRRRRRRPPGRRRAAARSPSAPDLKAGNPAPLVTPRRPLRSKPRLWLPSWPGFWF